MDYKSWRRTDSNFSTKSCKFRTENTVSAQKFNFAYNFSQEERFLASKFVKENFPKNLSTEEQLTCPVTLLGQSDPMTPVWERSTHISIITEGAATNAYSWLYVATRGPGLHVTVSATTA